MSQPLDSSTASGSQPTRKGSRKYRTSFKFQDYRSVLLDAARDNKQHIARDDVTYTDAVRFLDFWQKQWKGLGMQVSRTRTEVKATLGNVTAYAYFVEQKKGES